MSDEIVSIVTQTANQYGLDPNLLLGIGRIESGLDPSAQNQSSSAGGLFQFIDSTWATYGQGRNKMDPRANADAMARFTRANITYLTKKLGRPPTNGEIYLAHQQGAGGAAKILSNPSANAVELLGFDKVNLNVPSSMKSRVSTMTAGDFASLWDQKLAKATGGTMPYTQGALSPSLDPTGGNPDYTVYNSLDPSQTSAPVSAAFPITPATDAERRAAEAAQEDGPGVFEAIGDAAYSQNFAFMRDVVDLWEGQDLLALADPEWRPTPEYLKDKLNTAAIPMEYWDNFGDAQSEKHLEAMILRTQKIMEADKDLAKLGMAGNMAVRMAVAAADPVNWAVTAAVGVATMGTGLAPAAAAKFGRAGVIAVTAAEAGLGNVVSDMLQQSDNNTWQTADYLYSLGTGIVLGSAFGAFRRDPELMQKLEVVGRNIQQETAVASGRSVGAAQTPATVPGLPNDLPAMRAIGNQLAEAFGMPAFKNFRYDLAKTMQTTKSGFANTIGRYLVGDPVGKKGKVIPIGVDEVGDKLRLEIDTKWAKAAIPQWEAYVKRKGIKGADIQAEEFKFRNAITDFVESTDIERAKFDPEVQAAGRAMESIFGEFVDLLNNPGSIRGVITRPLRGAGNLKKNPNYVPRIWDVPKIKEMVERYGLQKLGDDVEDGGGLTSLVSRSLREAVPDMPLRYANKFAYALLNKVRGLDTGEEIQLHRIIAGEDLDKMRELLREFMDDANARVFSDEEVEEFVKKFEKPNVETAASSRLKNRTMLNSFTKTGLTNVLTGQVDELTMKDLFIRDSHFLMSVYNRQMSGRVALGQWQVPDGKGGYLVDGIDSDAEFDSLLRKTRKIMSEDGMSKKEIDQAVKRLQFSYDYMVGRPSVDLNDNFFVALKLMGDYNFLRVMGQVGFAQIPEIANVAATAGLKVFMQSFPGFRNFVRDAKTGKLNTKLAQEVEDIIGGGTTVLRNQWHLSTDDMAIPFNELSIQNKANRRMLQADRKLHGAKQFVAKFSGMAPINTLLERWNGAAIFLRFDEMAKKAVSKEGVFDITKLKPRELNRLKDLGLSDEMVERVMTQIRKHRTTVQGKTKLEALNIRQWSDPEAAAAFEMAAYRKARQVVMQNDLGQMAKWMSHPLARNIFQFRSFMLGAHSKIFLKGLTYHDMETVATFLGSAFVGAMTYTAQTYLNSVGKGEGMQAFLDERLTPGNIALGGVLRSSWFSTLAIPADALHFAFTGRPMTSFRTTGLATGFFGSPTIDFFDNLIRATNGVVEAPFSGEYSQQDATALRKLLPFQNMVGITHVLDFLISQLPKYEPRD